MIALTSISPEMILIIGLFLISVCILTFAFYINHRIGRLLKGKNAESLEETIITLTKQITDLEEFRVESEKYLTTVERRLRNAIQAVETVRFNPFKGTGNGGNQSFASAFLNENGDGLVISSLYASDRMSVFAKPVKQLESLFDLTDEEQKVLTDATTKVQPHVK